MGVLRRLWPSIVTGAVLFAFAAAGVFGSPGRPERFDAKTIVFAPAEDSGLRVTEFVDIDFGTAQRHGYERVLRTDLGWPLDIEATSSDMSASISAYPDGSDYVIRIGDPDVTADGRHRFILGYTLPWVAFDSTFNLSVIDPGEEFETGRFRVVLDGFRLDDALCSVGGLGDLGGCELVDGEFGQEVVFEPLAAGDGINVSGIASVTGEPSNAVDPGPPLPPVDQPSTMWRAGLFLVVAVAVGIAVTRRSIRIGSNEVAAVDAGGAAFPVAGNPTRRVTDDELTSMATVEFAPPDGVAPWEGRVLLDEGFGAAVPAWFSSMIGSGVLEIAEAGSEVVLSRGARFDTLGGDDAVLVASVLPGGERRLSSRSYDAGFATVWKAIESSLTDRVGQRGWWVKTPRAGAGSRRASLVIGGVLGLALSCVAGGVAFGMRSAGTALPWVIGGVPGAVVITALISALAALIASGADRASRTATGSAAFLRTESFRRFLAASEARHVDDAAKRGVLREYTAWAVALGEAEAWERAARSLGDAAVMAAVTSTAFMHHHSSDFRSITTTPSSSGGGGGGGVGGGGGGGSSGSW